MLTSLLTAALLLHAPSSSKPPKVALIASFSIPGTTQDKSGLTEIFTDKDKTPHNRLGGIGSAIAYTGADNTYLMLSDRAAGGAVPFRSRFHTFTITVTQSASPDSGSMTCTLDSTVLLGHKPHAEFVGLASAIDPVVQAASLRLDPEAIRVTPDHHVFITDEYGPWIDEFSMTGDHLRRITPPFKFLVKAPSADKKQEATNDYGRQPNGGIESLAISPDGSTLFAMLERPLIQDMLNDEGKKKGKYVRLIELDLKTGITHEYAYELDKHSFGVHEILAINATDFLVLERDDEEKEFRKVFRSSIKHASDISDQEALIEGELPQGFAPMSKKKFLNLSDFVTQNMPEKIEGLAFGPDLPSGDHLLFITSDNDYAADQPTMIWAFAVPPEELPKFSPPK